MKEWLDETEGPANYSVQAHIGWRYFFRGFISSEFTAIQEKFFRQQHLPKKEFSGLVWAQKLIQFLWQETQKLWKERCNQVHDEHGHRLSAQRLEEAKTTIRAMYSNKLSLLSADRDLLPGTAEDQLAKSPKQIINFVDTTYAIYEFCLQDAQKAIIAGNQDIREFIPSTNSAATSRAIRQVETARQAAATARAKQKKKKQRKGPSSRKRKPVTRQVLDKVKSITTYFSVNNNSQNAQRTRAALQTRGTSQQQQNNRPTNPIARLRQHWQQNNSTQQQHRPAPTLPAQRKPPDPVSRRNGARRKRKKE